MCFQSLISDFSLETSKTRCLIFEEKVHPLRILCANALRTLWVPQSNQITRYQKKKKNDFTAF